MDVRESFSDELEPGTTLLQGQYTIESYLNSGGFAITYLARDSLDRQVVIKECFPGSFCRRSKLIVQARSRTHQGEFKSIVKMFVQEARSLSKLKHPNIVGVHQVFEDNGTAYMALDLIEGRDLLDTLEDKDNVLTPDQVKGILEQLLDAVDYIHDENVLHRDISPDNILLTTDLTPILIDFGAAREQASQVGRVLSALRVVKDGYSPQEFYIAGTEQSPSSDLYALGASFYHVITGEIPPNSQLRLSAMAARESDPYEPLRGNVKGYNDSFLEAIDKSLRVMPKERVQSAQEWLNSIDQETQEIAVKLAAENEKEIEKTVTKMVSNARKEDAQAKRFLKRMAMKGVAAASPSGVAPRRIKAAPETEAVKATPVAETVKATPVTEAVAVSPLPETVLDVSGFVQDEFSEPKKSKGKLLLASVAAVVVIGAVVVTQTDILPFGSDDPAAAGIVTETPTPATPVETVEATPAAPAVTPGASADGADSGSVAEVNPAPVPRPAVADTAPVTVAPEAPLILTELTPPSAVLSAGVNPLAITLPGDVAQVAHENTVTAALAPEAGANDPIQVVTEPYVQPSMAVPSATEVPVLTSNWSMSLPFVPSEGDALAIGLVKAGAEPWVQSGLAIATINGKPVNSISDIENIVRDSTGPDATEVSVWFGVSERPGGPVSEFSAILPVIQKTTLANGTEFQTVFENGEWLTKVVAISEQTQGNLNIGDVLVAYLSTNERITGRDTIATLLDREAGAGLEQFNFVVKRDGSNEFAMLDISGANEN